MKQFKNEFGVVSESKALLTAFKEEVEKLGWAYDEEFVPWNRLPYNNCLYFAAYNGRGTLKRNHCSLSGKDKKTCYLPKDWDKALALASEVVEPEVIKPVIPEAEFKIGQWLYIIDSGCNNTRTFTGYIGKIKETSYINASHPTHFYIFEDGGKCTNRKNCTRLATTDEIKQQLIKLARDKGFVDGVAFKGCAGANKDVPTKIGVDHLINAMIGTVNEGVFCGDSWIFHKGKWGTIVEEVKIIEDKRKRKNTTYCRGQRFKKGNEEFILVSCGTSGQLMGNLINLDSGNMWSYSVPVKNAMEITETEFKSMESTAVGKFKLIKK